ncbi:ribosome maturation factor RimM [Marinobacter caseinilyticus]|uniref:ribosome maturation factor RimM n=1 Tax=Marinobacter caseinilyticus TaxID=2692195 RepID=UPI00140CA82C|nr:ribosome maturation factor RimM [Marinobacter caseinilyticus]
MTQSSQETVVGRITAVFGVKGWLKVYSYTDPLEGILNYRHWTAVFEGKRMSLELEEGRRQGPGIVVKLKGIDDRDLAKTYCGVDIVVPRSELPELPDGEFYWYQLEGLHVETVDGQNLGTVGHLLETGSNDVLVVTPSDTSIDQKERLIPYLPEQVVKSVDLESNLMVVDWDVEF